LRLQPNPELRARVKIAGQQKRGFDAHCPFAFQYFSNPDWRYTEIFSQPVRSYSVWSQKILFEDFAGVNRLKSPLIHSGLVPFFVFWMSL
jgi:hypothetical protein